jgi:phosphoglycolate phosphatase
LQEWQDCRIAESEGQNLGLLQSGNPATQNVVKLIVFDLDGTLIDSRRDLAASANAVLTACGAAPLPEDQIGRMVGDGAAMLVARAFAAAGRPQPPDALARFLAIYNGRLLASTRPYPDVPEVLARLRQRATLALLTNKPLAPTRDILAGLDLASYFAPGCVVGGDGPFARKPDPAGLRYLLAEAGASPQEAVLVGDSPIDWQTSRAAGTRVCLAAYGFGFEGFLSGSLGADDRLVRAPADLLVAL